MGNLLETASQWLSDQLDEHVSNEVRYSRGSLTVELVAGHGRTAFELTDSSGMIISVESRDFLISSALLVLDTVRVLPEVGDRIIETRQSQVHAYEVMRFGSEQHYRFCDPYGHKLRIHTKYVGVVNN